METRDLIPILKGVPETRLRILELAWELTGEDGAIDAQKVTYYYKEITEAVDEAEAYSKTTKEAAQCLKELARFSP